MSLREPLTGLFELDTAGTVLYYSPETDGGSTVEPLPDIIGRNLYTEIPVAQSFKTLRERLDTFRTSSERTQTFVFVFQFENRLLPMRVMLSRVRDGSERGESELILIQITKADRLTIH
ncbi:MAG: hypothetical protein WCB68_07730 [Pyrinomonadaceae bacterium]